MKLFAKVKDFAHCHMNKAKTAVVSAVICAMSVICGVTCFAAEGDTSSAASVRDQLKTSTSGIASDIMGTITDVLPIVLPIMGAMLVIGVGIAVVKKLTKKSSAG